MNIAELINENARQYSPYMNNLVNHLPMGQLALFKLTGDVNKVKSYTDAYMKRSNIDRIGSDFKRVESFDDCLGKRELYMPCLDLIREKLKNKDMEIKDLISYVLNNYTLGLSSGLFHTTIRLAYAVEGYQIDKALKEEVERALAYYITAYRKGGLFEREISKEQSLKEMRKFKDISDIKEIRLSDKSTGKKLQAFYSNKDFMKEGFIFKGEEDDKVEAMLKILVPAFYNTNNIVMLHAITGLHAMTVLKDYFSDYNRALDIFTTTALAHILTQKDLNLDDIDTSLNKNWDQIIKLSSNSSDVHTIKFGYSSKDLDEKFNVDGLKSAANKRAEKN